MAVFKNGHECVVPAVLDCTWSVGLSWDWKGKKMYTLPTLATIQM